MFRGKMPGRNTHGLLRLFSPASMSRTVRLWSRFASLENDQNQDCVLVHKGGERSYLPATTQPALPPPHTMMSNSSGSGDILIHAVCPSSWGLIGRAGGTHFKSRDLSTGRRFLYLHRPSSSYLPSPPRVSNPSTPSTPPYHQDNQDLHPLSNS